MAQTGIERLVDDILNMGGTIKPMDDGFDIHSLTYEWKTPKEVAKIFGVERHTVYYWIKWGWMYADEVPAKSRVRYRIPDSEIRRITSQESKLRKQTKRFLPRVLYQVQNGQKIH